ncbi:MAG: alcohol dehydrogenase [Candidatus Poribacteria bacterium]|nr:MAG: alcohol dehydrogenase [Candidatus Poribacteria bacterium]
MKAVQYRKSVPRYLLVRLLGRRFRRLPTGPLGLARLREVPQPRLPGPEWVRVRPRLSGICGSDLATLFAKGSPYFSPLVSTPFVLGHEVVGVVEEVHEECGLQAGDRVVLEPALSCRVRGLEPACDRCAEGRSHLCTNVVRGAISAGVQTGYCRDTGGGWSESFVAHPVQLHRVPEELSDEAAVLIEPLACCVHGVLQRPPRPEETVLVLGCGTIGLLTIAALRALGFPGRLLALAKYPHQGRWAQRLGADGLLPVGKQLYAAVCEETGATLLQPELGGPVLLGGVDRVYDCVGSSSSIDAAVRLTRSGGSVILIGMPAILRNVDWTHIWHKELELVGAYAYSEETVEGARWRTFSLAMELIGKHPQWAELVTHRFPLERYSEAIQTAARVGKSRAIKVVFQIESGL